MKFAKSITTTAVLSLFMLGNAWAADPPKNLTPLFGDVHATAGHEVTIPFIKFNYVDLDGYPDSVNVSFKVFTAGTTTPLLRQTQVKTIPTPAIPAGCSATDAADHLDMDFLVIRRGAQLDSATALENASKRMAMAVNMEVSNCGTTDTLSSFVYSADLSGTEAAGSPGPAWTKFWSGRFVEGFNGVDVDGDLVNDFQIITTGGPTGEGWNVGIVYAASKTGAINTTITTSNGSSYTLPTTGKLYLILDE